MLFQRNYNFRDPERLVVVISAEGEKTEKQYFEQFNSDLVSIVIIDTSKNESSPIHVRNRLMSFLTLHPNLPKESAWLVMDMDRQHIEHLPEICIEADQVGFNIALSNPCFEFWLWSHLHDPDATLNSCAKLEDALKNSLGGYNKSNLQADQFHPSINDAIARSKALPGNATYPLPGFPGTHVSRLIERILLFSSG